MIKRLPKLARSKKFILLGGGLFISSLLLITHYLLPITHTPVIASDKPSFIKVNDVEIGDLVFIEKNGQLNPDKIIEKQWIEEPVDVYNLTVGGGETYFANGVAVHNKGSTTHYAYFFFDSNGSGYHDSGETTLDGGLAYASFYNNYINDKEEVSHDVVCCNLNNDGCVTKVEGVAAAAKGKGFVRGDTFRAVPQTRRGNEYYVGGVKFKDYDGDTPRPVYRFAHPIEDDGDNCSYLSIRNRTVARTDWKPEKDYRGINTEGLKPGATELYVQLAEFNVDYDGAYYLSLALGGRDGQYSRGGITIYDITGSSLLPVSCPAGVTPGFPNCWPGAAWRFQDFLVDYMPNIIYPHGAYSSVCEGGRDTYCNLSKGRDYLMVFTASGSKRGTGGCESWAYYAGYPFLFWRGGQELTGGWYGDNRTSTVPIGSVICHNPDCPCEPSCVCPTLYPTSAVSGNLYQQTVSKNCSAYPATNPAPAITLVPQYSSGVTTNCVPNTGAGTYQCNISYNNRCTNPTPPLSQSFTLSISAPSYGGGQWEVGNSCGGGPDNTRPVASGATSTDWHIFHLITPWIKLKDASLATSGLGFVINPLVSPYDSDDNGQRYLIVSSAGGVGLATNVGSFDATSQPVSQNNWQTTSYTKNTQFNKENFLSYVQSRKQYQTLSSLDSSLSQISGDGIYYYKASGGPLTVSSSSTPYNFVLIVDGEVDISANFNRDPGTDQPAHSIAILADTINFDPSVAYAYGIFVASTVGTGESTSGLKIKGNLVTSTFNSQRAQTDNSYPSVFIVFNANTYLGLLPYLSVDKYNWQQLQ